MAIGSGTAKKKSQKKRYFDQPVLDEPTEAVTTVEKPTKTVFTDDGEKRVVPVDTSVGESSKESNEGKTKKGGKRKQKNEGNLVDTGDDGETIKRWYEYYESFNTQVAPVELVELKDQEIQELRTFCKTAFEVEYRTRLKENPSDAKWLQSAMEKGTMRDRASSGALLVQTNPFCNLQALETIIDLVKPSNVGLKEVVEVLTELMLNSLMPAYRKLIPIQMRGADWKSLQKQDIDKELRNAVYAHWHFEEKLRELYFNFLTNLSVILHSGQEESKRKTIIYTSKLLEQLPEKEAFLLTMLVNKLGDPHKTVAGKALYHLQKIVEKQNAMAYVVTSEVEKLLFRNNVSNAAQHYALCFLSIISIHCDDPTCKKLVQVCLAFFQIYVEKGEINSRTMTAILSCLRKAIRNIRCDVNVSEIVMPSQLNVIFRLVHLGNINIGIQALSLLLELTERGGPANDRFYNALYHKLLDSRLVSVGPYISNIMFYVLHRAMRRDSVMERTQAFIKRLLQVSFHFPPSRVCASLIVIGKVVRGRKSLMQDGLIYEEVLNENEHGVAGEGMDASVRRPKRYDAFCRSAAFAGAQFSLKYDLVRYLSYFHPTVQKFAECIITKTYITYIGDPLRDFSIGHFLERFAFKNPKKPSTEGTDQLQLGKVNKKADYVPSGSRGLPVASLTRDQCTEDEHYIFKFLEQKRERMLRTAEKKKAREKRKKGKGEDDSDDGDDDVEIGSDVESLNDDEFDAYLDRLGVPGGQDKATNMDRQELDFIRELEKDMDKRKGANKKSAGRKKAKASQEEDDEDGLDDWDEIPGDEDDDDEYDGSADEFGAVGDEDDDEFSDGGSVSLEEGDNDSAGEGDEGPVTKKLKKSTSVEGVSDRDFARKLKTTDMNSLFASADDFSEMLERSVDGPLTKKGGKAKKLLKSSHGTEGEVFNQDESSAKQMAWEQTRFSGRNQKHGDGGGKKQFRPKNFAGGKKHKSGGKLGGGKGKPKPRK